MNFKKIVDGIKSDFNLIQYLREKIIYPDTTYRILEDNKRTR